MASWTANELREVGDAQELELASVRDDAKLSAYTTMWVVRVGDDLYVRSAGGPDRAWYRRATASRTGRIRAGGIEREVQLDDAPADAHAAIDAAYHAKYDQYGSNIVGHVVGSEASKVTIRLLPQAQKN